jgi:hypothetical protein
MAEISLILSNPANRLVGGRRGGIGYDKNIQS